MYKTATSSQSELHIFHFELQYMYAHVIFVNFYCDTKFIKFLTNKCIQFTLFVCIFLLS